MNISLPIAFLYGGFLFILMAAVMAFIVISLFRSDDQTEEELEQEKEKMKKKKQD